MVKNRQPVQDLKEFAVQGSPVRALDTIEVFYSELGDLKPQRDFQRDLNEAMLAFGCSWRLADGHFFQVASEFIEREIIERTADLLVVAGFQGALDEFRAARDDLTSGDTKDAIHKANNSLESTFKTILGASSGTADDLVRQFIRAGHLDDVPGDVREPLRRILIGPSTVRHKLGGHGQGSEVVTVPRPYAELAVSLAGALISFAVQQHLIRCPPEPDVPPRPNPDEDEIPF